MEKQTKINKRPDELGEAIQMLGEMWKMNYDKIPYNSLDEALDAYTEDKTKFFSSVAYAGITCHFMNLPNPFMRTSALEDFRRRKQKWDDLDFNNMDEDE